MMKKIIFLILFFSCQKEIYKPPAERCAGLQIATTGNLCACGNGYMLETTGENKISGGWQLAGGACQCEGQTIMIVDKTGIVDSFWYATYKLIPCFGDCNSNKNDTVYMLKIDSSQLK